MVQTDLIIVLMYCTGKIYGTVIEGLIVFRRRDLLRACHTTRVFVNAQSMTRAVNPDSHSFSFLDPGGSETLPEGIIRFNKLHRVLND